MAQEGYTNFFHFCYKKYKMPIPFCCKMDYNVNYREEKLFSSIIFDKSRQRKAE